MDKSPGGGIQYPKYGQRDSHKIYAHGKRNCSLDSFYRCIAEPLQIRKFGSVVIHQGNIGGIYGKIVRVTDDRVVIMVGSEKTKLEMSRGAISAYADGTSKVKASSAAASEPEKEASKPSSKSIKRLGGSKSDAGTADTAEEKSSDTAEA